MKTTGIIDKKRELRALVRERFALRDGAELDALSAEILSVVEALEEFRNAGTVAMYWSLGNEVCTHRFIEKWCGSKNILLPVVDGEELVLKKFSCRDDMCTGPFGIAEPQCEPFPVGNYDEIDIIMVPGTGFDPQGHRLGKGKGFYDRLLPRTGGTKVGVCFDFQLFDDIPAEEHDIPMGIIVTNNKLIYVPLRGEF